MDATNMTTNVQAKPAKPPVTRVAYHGKGGQAFRLHLANLFLSVITLGIYSFWGKTRIRKYMTSHIAVQNDRFEYTGTGKELFYGALKAMLIFMPLMMCLYIPFIGILIFLGVFSVAIYLTLRYRLSRTKWRGIRFNLGGSLKEYFKLSLKRTFANIFTLGWAIPRSDILKWSYIANNMSYGDLKFSYQIDNEKMKRVTKIHLMTYPLLLLVVLIPIMMGGVMKGQEMISIAKERAEQRKRQAVEYPLPTSETNEPTLNQVNPQAGEDSNYSIDTTTNTPLPEEDFPLVILLIYPAIGIFFLARLWYYAALWQEKFRGLKLGGLRFKTDITGSGLAKLYFTNILIIIFTLGLGKPIALNRTLRYYATNMRIAGDLNALIAQQDQSKKTSGLGDALAADVGFDLGL